MPGTLIIHPPTFDATPLSRYTSTPIAGFGVLIDPEADSASQTFRRARAALAYDLERVVELVPPDALARIIGTPIVVTRRTQPRPDWDGTSAACLHVSEDWLTTHGYDAARAGVIEILHVDKYLLWRAEQPMMLLHELAHAYQLSLEEGYDNPQIAAAYEHAMAANLYDAVGHAMSDPDQTRPAYAMTNPQEYFAELSEAYFGRNDFFPFTRDELREHDPAGFAMIEEVWGIENDPAASTPKAQHPAVNNCK